MDFKILDNNRPIGISGHMRVKNQGFLIDKCIASCIDFLDELIITYNDCCDDTEAILKKYKNNKKIKIYKYDYEILFNKKKIENINKTCSNYYNFGLLKIKYKYYMKIDPDQFYMKSKMLKLREKILSEDDENKFYVLSGINIQAFQDNFYIYIGSRFNKYNFSPCNGIGDHFIFAPNSKTYYKDSITNKYSVEALIGHYEKEHIFVKEYMWFHFGCFKMEPILKSYLKHKNENKNLLPISYKNFPQKTLFFSKKWLMFRTSKYFIFKVFWYLVRGSMYVLFKSRMAYNTKETLDRFKYIMNEDNNNIYQYYSHDEIFEIYKNFKKNENFICNYYHDNNIK